MAAAVVGSLAGAQTTERVSVATGWVQGNESSYRPSISADGRVVAFDGFASNLVPSDTNGTIDVFVRDRQLGTTELASVATGGVQGNAQSAYCSISADGRFVAYHSFATNLVTGDTNGYWDIFVRDRQLGTTERVNVATGGAQSNGDSGNPRISADGRFVAFVSSATNLVPGDTNGAPDVFVRDRQNGTTECVSVDSAGGQGNGTSGYSISMSADGRCVAFGSSASNLVAGDTNGLIDIFVHDRQNATTERVSVDSSGVQGNGECGYLSVSSISSDGRFVAFESAASNLVPGDTNGSDDIFLRDRQNATTERVSLATGSLQANGASENPSVSADGRFVAFEGWAANFVPGDTNGSIDAFVRDRQNGTTERVSLDSAGAQGNSNSTVPSISPDGRFVAFQSLASNLVAGDTNAQFDIFVGDRAAQSPPAFCLGDASAGACPCGNNGLPGRGCENSAATGGALLTATGNASLASDTLVLSAFCELPSAPSIFLQGSTGTGATVFGDGLLCLGGALLRMYVHFAGGGAVGAPQAGDLSISARSAALGDVLTAGATRYYQTYYRDPQLAFCPNPPGNSWNVSSGLVVVWGQ